MWWGIGIGAGVGYRPRLLYPILALIHAAAGHGSVDVLEVRTLRSTFSIVS